MQYTLAMLSFAAAAVVASPAPLVARDACSPDYSGQFQIAVVNSTITAAKRDIQRRAACGAEGLLTLSLAGGVLTDSKGRTGYIASNNQFQFDAPVQADYITAGGFSACSNGSLALSGNSIFYSCESGGFSNLYDKNDAAQCSPVLIDIITCSSSTSAVVSGASDGQPQVTAEVSLATDGQPQVTAIATLVSQIADGQPQVATVLVNAPPVAQIGDGQIQVTSVLATVPVVSTPAPVPASSAPEASSAPVVVAPSSAAPASSASPVTIPAPATTSSVKASSTAAVVTSAATSAAATTGAPSVAPFSTGAANANSQHMAGSGMVGVVIGLIAFLGL